MTAVNQRYTAVAIVLHWAIATAIIANFILGWWMHSAIDQADSRALAVDVFQIHKSLGLTVLLLSLLRLLWRWLNPPPPFPSDMPQWEQRVARITHWAFYGLMLVIPLSGWLYVSAQWRGGNPLNVPTLWFGLFEVPHLFGLHETATSTRQTLAAVSVEAHEILAFTMAGLLGLHVAAALKHQFVNRDEVLGHMVPAFDTTASEEAEGWTARRLVLLTGFTLINIAAIALLITVLQIGKPSTTTAQAGRVITSSQQSNWLIDPQESRIIFSGSHAGTAFKGEFTRWSGDLRIDPADPAQASIRANIDTASATNGIPLHDETLPQTEWFDVANHPVAEVRSTAIRQTGPGNFTVDGVLDIKGHPTELKDFQMNIDADRLTITGRITLNRRAIDLGMESDPQGEWVSLDIPVNVRLTATRR